MTIGLAKVLAGFMAVGDRAIRDFPVTFDYISQFCLG